MASPLLPYANSRILIRSEGGVEVVGGRIEASTGPIYLIKAFLAREQSAGTSTGSVKVPSRGERGSILPGGSGDSFLYRGYALQYAIVNSTFVLGESSENGLSFSNIQQQLKWMLPGTGGIMKFGDDPIMTANIERSSGAYGGQGIDQIIYQEIGGVQIQVMGGDLQN